MIRSNSQFISEKNKSPFELANDLGVNAGKNRRLSKSNSKNFNPAKNGNVINNKIIKPNNNAKANINFKNINYVTITNSSNKSPNKYNPVLGGNKNNSNANSKANYNKFAQKPLIVKNNVNQENKINIAKVTNK